MKLIIMSIQYIIGEHKNNFTRIWFIAKNHLKKQTSETSLGLGWVVVHDIIYFAVFALFRYMLSGGRSIDGMNIIMFLFSGLVPWFFINDVINAGTRCFTKNHSVYSNMSFPTSIIPTYETVAIFLKRLISFSMLFIVTLIMGYFKYFNILLFLYYFVAMILISYTFCMFLSPLLAISKDLDQMYRAILRVLFYMMPIIWNIHSVAESNPVIITILKLNPLVYVILGFRDAFFYGDAIPLDYSLYFWGCVVILFVAGSVLLNKLNKYYDDWV